MMTETRVLTYDNLRALCIEKNWFNRGNSEDYEGMLRYAAEKKNVQTSTIVIIARTIKQNSDTEHPISSICFEIARKCYSFFEGNE
jgi:hypothetical protein